MTVTFKLKSNGPAGSEPLITSESIQTQNRKCITRIILHEAYRYNQMELRVLCARRMGLVCLLARFQISQIEQIPIDSLVFLSWESISKKCFPI